MEYGIDLTAIDSGLENSRNKLWVRMWWKALSITHIASANYIYDNKYIRYGISSQAITNCIPNIWKEAIIHLMWKEKSEKKDILMYISIVLTNFKTKIYEKKILGKILNETNPLNAIKCTLLR